MNKQGRMRVMTYTSLKLCFEPAGAMIILLLLNMQESD